MQCGLFVINDRGGFIKQLTADNFDKKRLIIRCKHACQGVRGGALLHVLQAF